jgi:hypothetical protein
MTGARLVHDALEACGWSVEIADAQKVKGLAPFACSRWSQVLGRRRPAQEVSMYPGRLVPSERSSSSRARSSLRRTRTASRPRPLGLIVSFGAARADAYRAVVEIRVDAYATLPSDTGFLEIARFRVILITGKGLQSAPNPDQDSRERRWGWMSGSRDTN